VGDAVGVQVLQNADYFCDIEYLDFLGEFGDVEFDEVDELSSLAVLLDEVEVGLVLEGVFELIDSGVFHGGEQFLLHHGLVLLLLSLQLLLLNLLHGVDLLVRVLDDHVDVSVGSLPQPVLEGEVLDGQGHFLLGWALGLGLFLLHQDYIIKDAISLYNIFVETHQFKSVNCCHLSTFQSNQD
jgi:hypothetical protein